MRLARFGVVALLAAAIWVPSVAGACSIDAPMKLDRLLESGELYSSEFVGVHEQRHIARFPGIPGLVSARSASVVVRYWGEAPDLSVASHGAGRIPFLYIDGCGVGDSPYGHVQALANATRSAEYARSDFSNLDVGPGSADSPLSAVETTALDAHFGPATSVSSGPDDYVVAYALVLWRPLLMITALASIGLAIWSRVRGIDWGNERIFSLPTAFAGLLGVTAVVSVSPSLGVLDHLGLVIALVLSVLVGSLARVPWAVIGVGVLLWSASSGTLLGDLAGRDNRLQAALAAAILGVSALAWSRSHWTRFLATFTVVAGTFALVMGVADVRGYRNTTKGVALASIVTAVAAIAVWWLIFRDRPIRPGGARLLQDETAGAGQQPPSR